MVFLAPLVLVGCSDQIENENTALKVQKRALSDRCRASDAEIANLTTNVISLQSRIREMQTNDQEEITAQKRTIAALSAETIRQKEDIENCRRTLADQKALFEKYKEEVTQQLQKPGRVKVSLTYKDGSGNSNVADIGATVSLHLIKDTTIVYRALTDAEGVAIIDRVKPGKYLCVIHSGNNCF